MRSLRVKLVAFVRRYIIASALRARIAVEAPPLEFSGRPPCWTLGPVLRFVDLWGLPRLLPLIKSAPFWEPAEST
jgi:hypothetical protein